MNEQEKARLKELKEKDAAELSDAEKRELELLSKIEKQDNQIKEKDTLIGTKATEIGNLKEEIEKKSGKEKEALEQQLSLKQDALDTMKAGLDALKEAKELNSEMASQFSQKSSGHGDTVDPEELVKLERTVFANETAKAAVEELYKGMSPEDKESYRTDPSFKKLVLEKVAGDSGDEADDSPWSSAVKEDKGEPGLTPAQRVEQLFDKQKGIHRRLPPGTSGRGGRGKVLAAGMPKPAEREEDPRTY